MSALSHRRYVELRNGKSQDDGFNSLAKKSESLQEQAKRAKVEAERMQIDLNMEKISKLENVLNTEKNLWSNRGRMEEIRTKIITLSKNIDPSFVIPDFVLSENESVSREESVQIHDNDESLYKKTNNAKQISEEELKYAVDFYTSLPERMRLTLASVVELDAGRTDPFVIVLSLYELGEEIPTQTLISTYDNLSRNLRNKTDEIVVDGLEENKVSQVTPLISALGDSSGRKITEDFREDSLVKSLLPAITRRIDKAPLKEDVDLFVNVICGREIFMPSQAPQKIIGGYIIRGMPAQKFKDGNMLIDAIDARLAERAPEWRTKFQASYIYDPTPRSVDDGGTTLDGEPVLLLTTSDFSPVANRLFSSFVSVVSIFLAFLFSISTFGANDLIMSKIAEANATGNYDTSWLNELIAPLLLTVATIQGFHECAQTLVAWKENFKVSPPTILPLLTLPYLTFQSRLKTSPRNYASLFNYAVAGPAVGMIVSFIFLLVGLKMTVTMDASTLQYAPSLPVGFLRLSSLGGSIVDYFLGGDGLIISQDPSVQVSLHPFAIGGFAGLMINALDSLPVGSTDGGRIAQSALGRSGQLVFGGFVFFGLLLYTAFPGHRDIFLTYLLINSFTQKDNEIPCRNEVDGNDSISRTISAIALWFLSVLILAPVS